MNVLKWEAASNIFNTKHEITGSLLLTLLCMNKRKKSQQWCETPPSLHIYLRLKITHSLIDNLHCLVLGKEKNNSNEVTVNCSFLWNICGNLLGLLLCLLWTLNITLNIENHSSYIKSNCSFIVHISKNCNHIYLQRTRHFPNFVSSHKGPWRNTSQMTGLFVPKLFRKYWSVYLPLTLRWQWGTIQARWNAFGVGTSPLHCQAPLEMNFVLVSEVLIHSRVSIGTQSTPLFGKVLLQWILAKNSSHDI